MRSKINAS
uniref:Uncharacterized protein n=1 Tax=Rhizophora mucronata TaxID=61149 RepID=A0A2P2NC71_RHIMU